MRGLDISLRAAFRVWQRNATVYRKTFHLNILPNFFEPVFYLLGLGLGLGRHLGGGVEGLPYLKYIAPGLVAYNAAMGATFEVTYNTFVKMTFARTYDSVIATPVSVEDVVLGEVLWAVTRAFIYAAAFLAIATAMGAVPPFAAAMILLVTPLVGLLFAAIGMIYTSLVPVIDFYSFYYTLFMTPLFLFSGIFFPLSDLPEWLQRAVWFTPLFHGVRAANDLAWGKADAGTAASLAWLAVASVVSLALALRLMRRRLVK
jgi:lipooligosaccharide transport system permease protein